VTPSRIITESDVPALPLAEAWRARVVLTHQLGDARLSPDRRRTLGKILAALNDRLGLARRPMAQLAASHRPTAAESAARRRPFAERLAEAREALYRGREQERVNDQAARVREAMQGPSPR
jgi:hypothetical protein